MSVQQLLYILLATQQKNPFYFNSICCSLRHAPTISQMPAVPLRTAPIQLALLALVEGLHPRSADAQRSRHSHASSFSVASNLM
jgi:hypothetical protein